MGMLNSVLISTGAGAGIGLLAAALLGNEKTDYAVSAGTGALAGLIASPLTDIARRSLIGKLPDSAAKRQKMYDNAVSGFYSSITRDPDY